MTTTDQRPLTTDYSPERVFIGLGTNVGDREENLRRALNHVGELQGTRLVRASRFLVTPAWGYEEQPDFLNAVAEVRTALEPEALLDALKRIEREMGREPTFRWGPRLIDLDILIYGARRLQTDRLTIPHPHLLEREFVWRPLQEIAPDVLEELRHAAVPLRSPGPERE